MTDKLSKSIGKKKAWQVLLLLVLIAGFVGSVQATSFSVNPGSSTVMSIPGYWELNGPLDNFNSTNCIIVTASDIIIDGKGYSLGTNPLILNPGAAIYLSSGVKNVTIENFNINGNNADSQKNFNWSIWADNTNTVWLENNVLSNTRVGILVDWGQNININDNSISNQTNISSIGTGILIRNHAPGTAPITIVDNTIEKNIGEGIIVQDTEGNIDIPGVKIIGNIIRNNTFDGILLTNSNPSLNTGTYTTISGDNTIENNGLNGISIIKNSRNYTIDGNTIFGNSLGGINETQTTGPTFSGRNLIINNVLTGNLISGMVFNRSYPVDINNNTLDRNTVSGINPTNSGSLVIHQNRISNSPSGIDVNLNPYIPGSCDNSLIYSNTISNGSTGIINRNTSRSINIYDNIIQNTGVGLQNDLTNSLIQNNTIKNVNEGIIAGGFSIQIFDNNVKDFRGRGIYLPGSTFTVKNNTVISKILGSTALEMSASSSTIYNNIFYAGKQIDWIGTVVPGPNVWNILSSPGPNIIEGPWIGGNYWGQINNGGWSQTIPDTNGDGFCDSPATLGSSDNIDYLPLHDATLNAIVNVTPLTGPSILPAVYQFDGSRSSGNIASYQWTFTGGNPATATGEVPPTVQYTQNGSFVVTLVISSAVNSTSNTTNVIAGTPGLLADFSGIPQSGNAPLQVQFSDRSTGTPTIWNWQFGDSTTNATPNPLKTYTNAGIYSVGLTVSNATYTNTSNKTNYIAVNPTANFTYSSNQTYGPMQVQFRDQSLGNPDTWDWEFGDGITSGEQSPAHIYTALGNYQINLTVNKMAGASILTNTTSQLVNLNGNLPVADFAMVPPVGDAPLNVTFIDQSTGNPTTWSWQYQKGSGSWMPFSTVKNPQFGFTDPGTYTINLTAGNQFGVSAPVTKTLTVNAVTPIVDFGIAPISGAPPLAVTFFDLSTGTGPTTTYSWDFGDRNSSVGRVVNHTYTSIGNYTVRLIVQNPGALVQFKEDNVTVTPVPVPSASFTTNGITNGYVPLTVQFNDTSSGSPDAWLWTFGDGASSGDKNPVHTYSTPGNYVAGLVVSNRYGSTTVTHPITVTPVARFSVTPASGTNETEFRFTDVSEGAPTQWLWNFGDGVTSSEKNPRITFTQPGVKSVTLKVISNGVPDTSPTTTISVGQVPLQAAFTATPVNKTAPLIVYFFDQSRGVGIQRWNWDFGDGVIGTDMNPSHSYLNSGIYTVTLTVTNLTWQTSSTSEVISVYPNAQFSFNPTSPVVNENIQFADESVGGPINGYNWDFSDGTPTNTSQNPVHSYSISDHYPVRLNVTGGNGLMDTAGVYVNVKPIANFTQYPAIGGSPLAIQFVDQSLGGHWFSYWEFGDGMTAQKYNPVIYPPTLDQSNPVHIYEKYGNYLVNLSVYSYGGWSITSSQWVNVTGNQPTAAFTMSPSSGPYPLTVNFVDQSSGLAPLSYDWNFGDGSAHSFIQSPNHIYPLQGTYNVTLVVSNTGGSSAPAIHPIVVTNQASPIAAFTMSPSSGPYPLTVNFIDQSSGLAPLSYDWNFGDGSGHSTLQSPNHMYQSEGSFTVNLTVTNAGGSSIATPRTVVVNGPADPIIAFTAIPRSGTAPLNVSFIDQSTADPDVSTYLWDFGDRGSSSDRNPAHLYGTPGSYNVSITVTTNGKSNQLNEEGFIVVNAPGNVTADFNASPSGGIEPVVVQFYDRSAGTPAPTSWFWDFDDQYAPTAEKTSTLQSPVHNYTKAGNYTPKLTASNSQGPNTKVYPGVIYVRHTTPVAAFNATPTTGYNPFSVNFTDQSIGQTLTAWDWNFGDGGTSQTQSPVYTFNTPGTYSVTFKSYNDGGWSAPITKLNLITVLAAPPTPPANIIKLYPGWNFVSTPRKLTAGSDTVNVVFANVDFDHHSPLLYDGQTKTWIQFISGTVKPLDGVWVYSKYQMDVTLQFDTTNIPLPPSKLVYRGWNAVGETGVNPISARELLTQVGQLDANWDTLIGINASTHVAETYIRGSINPDYSDLKFTFPTKGYWLQMNTDDTLMGLV